MYPLRFHQRCWLQPNHQGPPLVPYGCYPSQIHPHISIQTYPKSYNSIRTTGWYTKTSLYHILSQAVPIYAHGCTVFMGGRSMNRSLDLGMITIQRLLTPTRHSPELSAPTRHSSQSDHPKSLSSNVAKGLPTETKGDIT
jgi:hypothetical protein